jgi:tetratricopeptide (TPR) repeat protein
MEKIMKWIVKHQVILIFVIIISVLILYIIPLKGYYKKLIALIPLILALLFYILVSHLQYCTIKLDEQGRKERLFPLFMCAIIALFLSTYKLGQIDSFKLNKKMDIGINWQLTNAETLLLEKGVLNDILKHCWDKTDNTIFDNKHYATANKAYDEGKYINAIEEYSSALREARVLPPDDIKKITYIADIYMRKGFCYEKIGEKQKAIASFKNSVDVSQGLSSEKDEIVNGINNKIKGYIGAYLMLARLYAEEGKFSEAHSVLERAGEVWKDDSYYLKEIYYHKIYVRLLEDIDNLQLN